MIGLAFASFGKITVRNSQRVYISRTAKPKNTRVLLQDDFGGILGLKGN